jgi:hypothetical protein
MQTTTLKLVAEVRVALTSCNAKQIYSLSSLSTSLLSNVKLKKCSCRSSGIGLSQSSKLWLGSTRQHEELARRCIAAKKDLHPPCILMAKAGRDRTHDPLLREQLLCPSKFILNGFKTVSSRYLRQTPEFNLLSKAFLSSHCISNIHNEDDLLFSAISSRLFLEGHCFQHQHNAQAHHILRQCSCLCHKHLQNILFLCRTLRHFQHAKCSNHALLQLTQEQKLIFYYNDMV